MQSIARNKHQYSPAINSTSFYFLILWALLCWSQSQSQSTHNPFQADQIYKKIEHLNQLANRIRYKIAQNLQARERYNSVSANVKISSNLIKLDLKLSEILKKIDLLEQQKNE